MGRFVQEDSVFLKTMSEIIVVIFLGFLIVQRLQLKLVQRVEIALQFPAKAHNVPHLIHHMQAHLFALIRAALNSKI